MSLEDDDPILALLRSADPARLDISRGLPPFASVRACIEARPRKGGLRRVLDWLGASRLAVLLFGVAVLGGGAGALAATGVIRIGSPVRSHAPANPRGGYGVVVGHQSGLLPLRVPDPSGGPPWGMRTSGPRAAWAALRSAAS